MPHPRSVDLVLDALEASGQADRTIVIFTSDHGDMAASHGLRQKGNLVYRAPHELHNLAYEPEHLDLVDDCRRRLEALIDREIGADVRSWVTERPLLLGWPTWHGDAA